jgi:hypothetical protein
MKKKLIEQFKEFVVSNDKVDIFKGKVSEIRSIYKGRGLQGNLMYYIFNSIWNRIPNLELPSVLKDKMGYAVRIGFGISSYNQLPLSFIVDKIQTINNFLMKDRGHILELVCGQYKTGFSAKQILSIVKNERSSIIAEPNYEKDIRYVEAIEIADEVISYLEKVIKAGKKNSNDIKVSLEDICDNVNSFSTNLNEVPVGIEIRKETIAIHMKEILQINNSSNEWIPYQKALLEFCGYVLNSDRDETYLSKTLDIDRLRNTIDELPVFVGGNDSYLPLSKAIATYKKKVSNYTEAIPFRLLGLRLTCDFADRGKLYYTKDVTEIASQLKKIRTENLPYATAEKILKTIDTIAKQKVQWESYKLHQEYLFGEHKDTGVKINNLEDSVIAAEDFGIACIDACLEIALKTCGGRTSESQLNSIVNDFVEKLKVQLSIVVNNETIFLGGASMEWRFTNIIFPAYEAVLNSDSDDVDVAKAKLYETHKKELLNNYDFKGQYRFAIINPTKDSYNNPEVTYISFGDGGRELCGIDLGQKKQTGGYTLQNTFNQVKGHNRSKHNDEHSIDNLEYWKWFARDNQDRVSANEPFLVKNKLYDVLADSATLIEIFK